MTVIFLGHPEGKRLRDLSLVEEKRLDDWLTQALTNPPSKRDLESVVEFTRALSTIARRRGIAFRFDGKRKHERHGSYALGKNIPGCVGGSKRKVTLAERQNLVGQKVEPYHEREWRDDVL